jgi:2-oxoglutarate dehydrogenase complex dehydrogenase (E1) component-like enzyme
MYINNHKKCNWIRQKFEDPSQKKLPSEDIERAIKRLIRAAKYK